MLARSTVTAMLAGSLYLGAQSVFANIGDPSCPDAIQVINIPPSTATPEIVRSDTRINAFDGGVLPFGFVVGGGNGSITNLELNILGGRVGAWLLAGAGSTVNVAGGRLGVTTTPSVGNTGFFFAGQGSVVNLSGGALSDSFSALDGSTVTISGGEFRLDGELIDLADGQLPLNVPVGALLSGTLADGTPFAFLTSEDTSSEGDSIANDTLTLVEVPLPTIGPSLLTASTDAIPLGIREGQTLVVDDGAVLLENFAAGRGSRVIVETGGRTGPNLEAVGAIVDIVGGFLDNRAVAFHGSVVNVSSGAIGTGLDAFHGSQVNISGGSVGSGFRAHDGSEVNLVGGTLQNFSALEGSTVTISGGSAGDGFSASEGSTVTIRGGTFGERFHTNGVVNIQGDQFAIDGEPVCCTGRPGRATVELPLGSVLSGTLADGTPLAFSSQDLDDLSGATIQLSGITLPPPGPAMLTASTDPLPLGIRSGQTLVVDNGGMVSENFNAGAGSEVLVLEGGVVEDNLEVVAGRVVIDGGQVGPNFGAFVGAQVDLRAGSIGNSALVDDGLVTISGGSVGSDFVASGGSVVDITGGTVQGGFALRGASVANISGGQINQSFTIFEGSTAHITSGSHQGSFTLLGGATLHLANASVRSVAVSNPRSMMESNLNMVSGSMDALAVAVNGKADISGGTVGNLTVTAVGGRSRAGGSGGAGATGVVNMSAGVVDFVDVQNEGAFNLSGGIVDGRLTARNQGVASIFGGSVTGHIFLQDEGVLNLAGGLLTEQVEVNFRSALNVSDGTVGGVLNVTNRSVANVMGGEVLNGIQARNESEINLSGGVIANSFIAENNTTVNISGGLIYGDVRTFRSVVRVSAGTIESDLIAMDSELHFSGGRLLGVVSADLSSEAHLLGRRFLIDGVDITASLTPGEPMLITERDVTLSGRLADRTPFRFELDTRASSRGGRPPGPFAPGIVTITLVPEPASAAMLAISIALIGLATGQRFSR